MKTIIWMVVVVLIGIGVYILVRDSGESNIYSVERVDWWFTESEAADEFGAPTFEVRVQPAGVRAPTGEEIIADRFLLGEFQGTCSVIDDLQEPADGIVKSYAQCWWAGAGTQFRALERGNVIVIEKRDVQEEDIEPASWGIIAEIDLRALEK